MFRFRLTFVSIFVQSFFNINLHHSEAITISKTAQTSFNWREIYSSSIVEIYALIVIANPMRGFTGANVTTIQFLIAKHLKPLLIEPFYCPSKRTQTDSHSIRIISAGILVSRSLADAKNISKMATDLQYLNTVINGRNWVWCELSRKQNMSTNEMRKVFQFFVKTLKSVHQSSPQFSCLHPHQIFMCVRLNFFVELVLDWCW